jgi:hypothetical protein
MGDPNAKIIEEQLCSLTADYLATLRDGLIEVSQILQDKLFEMDTEQKKAAADIVQDALKTLR